MRNSASGLHSSKLGKCYILNNSNCYNTMSRKAILDKMLQTEALEHLTTFTAAVLVAEPALEAKCRAWGKTDTGSAQGDPWSGAAVALGLQTCLEELDAECGQGGGACRAGADDIFALGPAEVVLAAVENLEREIKARCSLTLQWSKSKMYCREGNVPETAPAGLVLAGEQVGEEFLRGLMVFGVPVGSDEYVEFKLNEVVENIIQDAGKVQYWGTRGRRSGLL